MKETRLSTGLVGKGGVGLVMFHLARRGWDFTETTGNSENGDIWVRVGGSKLSIEVKTTRAHAFILNRPQLSRVDYVVLVRLHDAGCWILSSQEARALCVEKAAMDWRTFSIQAKNLPAGSRGNWSRLSGALSPQTTDAIVLGPKGPRGGPPRGPASGKIHTVTRRMANGELRQYSYDRSSGERMRLDT